MNLVDGVLTLHQSDIDHYMKCPEQFRVVNHIGPDYDPEVSGVRVETDAATVGSCLHAVIESDLRDNFKSVAKMKQWAHQWYGETIKAYILTETEYRTETFDGDPTKTLAAVDQLVDSWWKSSERKYWLGRDPKSYRIEESFDVHFVDRPNRAIHEIRLAGTPDIIDTQENRVVDWKSASREYQRWERQRWAPQPTAYTYAAADLGLIQPNGDGLYRFDYRIFVRKAGPVQAQSITVFRGPGQWSWMVNVTNNIADMIESDAAHWPLRDDHALCGPKWCPIWDDCKGSFVTEDWT